MSDNPHSARNAAIAAAVGVDLSEEDPTESQPAAPETRDGMVAFPELNFSKILLELPLYAEVDRAASVPHLVQALRQATFQIDAHCIYCKREVPFVAQRTNRTTVEAAKQSAIAMKAFGGEPDIRPTFFNLTMICQRKQHKYSYEFFSTPSVLVKVGQYPSMEDVAGADIEKYRRILGPDFSEMRKAGGLISHGIGIGAFVYLRRIFERLIEAARAEVDPNGDNKDVFYRLRMADKIAALSSVLPASVVDFKDAYGILSKGLHELTEADCKSTFRWCAPLSS
ncbi:MAG: hypothetical protein EOP50_14370 [Sphingobacteriales bacterium]|nr:MAG: hypothetical protein EOP50_14370 [Sphingobacteriales bacterium]